MKVPSIFSPSGALQYQLSSESSNSSLIRATGAIILAKNMYCNAQIMAVTGHKSVQALSMYQRVDDGDKIRMGKSLTDNVLKEPYKTMAISNADIIPLINCTQMFWHWSIVRQYWRAVLLAIIIKKLQYFIN
jgi:hypothetical protein